MPKDGKAPGQASTTSHIASAVGPRAHTPAAPQSTGFFSPRALPRAQPAGAAQGAAELGAGRSSRKLMEAHGSSRKPPVEWTPKNFLMQSCAAGAGLLAREKPAFPALPGCRNSSWAFDKEPSRLSRAAKGSLTPCLLLKAENSAGSCAMGAQGRVWAGDRCTHVCRTQRCSYTCECASSSFTTATRRRPRPLVPHHQPLDMDGGCWVKHKLPRQLPLNLGTVLIQFSEMEELGLCRRRTGFPFQKVRGGQRCCCAQPPEPLHLGIEAGGKLRMAKGPRGAPCKAALVQRPPQDVGCSQESG